MTLEEMTAQLKKFTVTALAALVAAAASVASERRLAGTIRTDEADLLPLLERRGRLTKRICLPFCLPMLSRDESCAQGLKKRRSPLMPVAHRALGVRGIPEPCV
jgi:hypothetical protein